MKLKQLPLFIFSFLPVLLLAACGRNSAEVPEASVSQQIPETTASEDPSTQTENQTTTVPETTTEPGTTTEAPEEQFTLKRRLSGGMTGDDVWDIQMELYELGYLDEWPDGEYGDNTFNAVMAFQANYGLNANGIVDQDTAALLYQEDIFYTMPLEDRIRAIFNSITTEDMTPDEKLEAVFYYVADRNNYQYELNRIPYYTETDWPQVYAEDILAYGASDCHGYAALFGYLAGMCDYSDQIYWVCPPDGQHAWVEIDDLIYDPMLLEAHNWHGLVYGWTYEEGAESTFGMGYADPWEDPDDYVYIKITP